MRPLELRQRLKEHHYEVSDYIVHQLLEQAGLRRRSYLKAVCLDRVPRPNDQFERIALLKERFFDAGMPVLSIDTKQYKIGQKATSIFTENIHDFVQFDQDLPQWNYSLLKQNRELVF